METKNFPAFKSLLVAFAAVGAMAMQDASAATYNFTKITSNAPEDLASQLTMEVTAVGTTQASFTFYNDVGIASSITDIYFDAVSTTVPFSGYGTWSGSAGVVFSAGANPSNLPSGNTIGFTATYSGDSDAPVASNGVNASGEWVSVTGTFAPNEDFDSLIAALAGGTFRVGLHVQSIGTSGNSDGYVNNVAPVPLPAAAWLFGPALVGLVTLSRRKKI